VKFFPIFSKKLGIKWNSRKQWLLFLGECVCACWVLFVYVFGTLGFQPTEELWILMIVLNLEVVSRMKAILMDVGQH
jgi:hypothetical protein